uniref:Uncharacterized protein n=1 Tax=Anguilla anguilla TaxID=7936 RepID=A0A0E9X5P5_ANGAN
MYSILHYKMNLPYLHTVFIKHKKRLMSAQYSLEDTQSMFTKMLHFRWVSFNGVQRVCDPQDIFETRVN